MCACTVVNENGSKDVIRLCTWNGISDAELSEVFSGGVPTPEGAPIPAPVQAAKHLISWCLKGDPKQRPTLQQVSLLSALLSANTP